MVVLVPRQLRMTGMTGNVPYYGGRFTPAQAYAASHARPPQRPQPSAVKSGRETLQALDHLLETGLIDQQEYDRLRERILR